MGKRDGASVAVLMAFGLLLAGPARAAEPGQDARALVPVDAKTRQAVLVEMRDFLYAVQHVMKSALDGDMAAAAGAARHVGLSHFATASDPSDPATAVYKIGTAAPAEFRQLGAQTHAGFDRVAALAEGGADTTAVLKSLATNMNRCLACHATYRFPSIEPDKATSLPSTVMNPPHGTGK